MCICVYVCVTHLCIYVCVCMCVFPLCGVPFLLLCVGYFEEGFPLVKRKCENYCFAHSSLFTLNISLNPNPISFPPSWSTRKYSYFGEWQVGTGWSCCRSSRWWNFSKFFFSFFFFIFLLLLLLFLFLLLKYISHKLFREGIIEELWYFAWRGNEEKSIGFEKKKNNGVIFIKMGFIHSSRKYYLILVFPIVSNRYNYAYYIFVVSEK